MWFRVEHKNLASGYRNGAGLLAVLLFILSLYPACAPAPVEQAEIESRVRELELSLGEIRPLVQEIHQFREMVPEFKEAAAELEVHYDRSTQMERDYQSLGQKLNATDSALVQLRGLFEEVLEVYQAIPEIRDRLAEQSSALAALRNQQGEIERNLERNLQNRLQAVENSQREIRDSIRSTETALLSRLAEAEKNISPNEEVLNRIDDLNRKLLARIMSLEVAVKALENRAESMEREFRRIETLRP